MIDWEKAAHSILIGGIPIGLTPWIRPWAHCVRDDCTASILGWRAVQVGKEAAIEYACSKGHRFTDAWQPPDEVAS